MVCFRSRRLAAGIFVCSAVLGACGGKKEEGKAAEDKGGAASAVNNKDLDMIPVESEVVLGLDVAAAQKSALFRDFALPALTKSGEFQKVSELLKTKCNIDPLSAATRLTAGVKVIDNRTADAVAVVHGIEKAKALPCIDQIKDQLAAERLEVTKDGDVVTIKGADGDVAFTFTGDTTAVVVVGPRANKEGVLAVAQGKSPLKTSKEFAEMYNSVNTGHTAWALVRGDTPFVAKNLERLDMKSKAIFGSVNAGEGLEAAGRARLESAEQATKLAALIKSQAGVLQGMAEKLEIEPENNDVRVAVKLTGEQLKNVIGFARMLTRGR